MKLRVRIWYRWQEFVRSLKSHPPSQMTIPKKIVVIKGKIPIVVLSSKRKKNKTLSIVFCMNTQWLPPILRSMFPFGRDCWAFPSMTSSHWPPGGPKGGQIHPDICDSKSPFASSASKMGHYSRLKPHPATWKQQGDLWPNAGEEVGPEARGPARCRGVKRTQLGFQEFWATNSV